jgi:hypothetical protein
MESNVGSFGMIVRGLRTGKIICIGERIVEPVVMRIGVSNQIPLVRR